MAQMMNIPILGVVENMSYLECPDCGKKIAVFGESKLDAVADEYGIKVLGRIPIDPKIAAQCDAGCVEDIDAVWLGDAIAAVSGK